MASSGRIIKTYTDLDHHTYLAEVARGRVSGSMPIGAYGKRVAIGAEQGRVIWPNGTFTLLPEIGAQLTIVSTDAEDGAVGLTGALVVEMHYLDANLEPQIETITMTGLTPILTDATDIRFVQCMHLTDVGSVGAAVGTITAKLTTITHSIIDTGEVRCTSSARMIPANKRVLITGAAAGAVSGTAAAGVTVNIVASELDIHQYLDPLILIPHAGIAVQDTSTTMSFDMPLVFSAGTVVAMTMTTDKAAITSASWFGILEDV